MLLFSPNIIGGDLEGMRWTILVDSKKWFEGRITFFGTKKRLHPGHDFLEPLFPHCQNCPNPFENLRSFLGEKSDHFTP